VESSGLGAFCRVIGRSDIGKPTKKKYHRTSGGALDGITNTVTVTQQVITRVFVLIHQSESVSLSPNWGKQENNIYKGEGASMKKVLVFLSLLALAVALPAGAQMPAKSLNRIIVVKTKPSMSAQWEEGLKKLNDWARQHKLPLTNHCWSIVSGPRTGQYVVASPGHDWKDFDAAEKVGQGVVEQIQADLEPYTESHLTSYWLYQEDLSGHAFDTSQSPPAFVEVTTYFLKPGGGQGVTDAIKAANAAIQKSHWPGKPSGWYSLVNGGGGPQLAHVIGHENWADFQPPEKNFFEMLNDVYGKEGAAALGKKFFTGLRSWRSEIWRSRPDLSYTPASQ
jgi:hypothetical protein